MAKNTAKERDLKQEHDQDNYIPPEIVQRYIDKFNKATKGDVDRYTRESALWFSDRIRKDTNINRNKLLTGTKYKKLRGSERSVIGRMFFFDYDAETAGDKESGLYDRYPLVFIFNQTKTNENNTVLWGLNFHYLTSRERFTLFTALLKLKSTKRYTEKTKLKLQWEVIKAASAKLAMRAVHAYRIDRFNSKLIEIDPRDWEVVTFLRTELFLKPKSEELVHQSFARKKIRDNSRTSSKARHEAFAKEHIRNNNR